MLAGGVSWSYIAPPSYHTLSPLVGFHVEFVKAFGSCIVHGRHECAIRRSLTLVDLMVCSLDHAQVQRAPRPMSVDRGNVGLHNGLFYLSDHWPFRHLRPSP